MIALSSLILVAALGSTPPAPELVAFMSGTATNFSLVVDGPRTVAANSASVFRVILKPGPAWHLNLDYPTKLEIGQTRETAIATAKQNKQDATTLTEDTIAFDVTFTPNTVGERVVSGRLKFAVCKEDQCAPQSAPVSYAVRVE